MQNRIARYFEESSSESTKFQSKSEPVYLDIQQFAAFLKPDTSPSRSKRAHQKQQLRARRSSELGWLLAGIGMGLLGGLALARLFTR